MPAKPVYFHRLGDAVQALKEIEADWIDRRTVEEILGVSKTVAWRIMRRCGAEEGPGGALVTRREGLIAAFLKTQATGSYEHEIRRRDRIAGYLDRMAELGRARRIQVAPEERALGLVGSRFRSLPPGVELARRRLTIEFSTSEGFLEKIGAVIFALKNDFEAIRQFIDEGDKPA